MNRMLVPVVALLPMLFWGMSFVWTKIVYRYYDPISTVTLRLVIASALLSLFIRFTGRREKIRREDWKWFILLAFLEPFCYFLGESFGVKLVSATLSAIIIATIPVVTPVFAFFLLGERLSPLNIFGLLMSFLGVGIMVVAPGFRLAASPLGLACLGFAVLSAVGYSLLIRKFSMRYSSLTIVNLQNVLGIVFFIPLFLRWGLPVVRTVPVTGELVTTLVLLAVLCSTVAFILLTIVIREIGVARANIYTNTIPVFTAIFAWFMLGETLDPRKLTGMAVVLAGLFLSQLKRKTPPPEELLYVEG